MFKKISLMAACAGILASSAYANTYQPIAPTLQIDAKDQFWTYMVRDAVVDVTFSKVGLGQPFTVILERDPTMDIPPVLRWPKNVVWGNGSAPSMNVASIAISGFYDGKNYVVTYVAPKYTR